MMDGLPLPPMGEHSGGMPTDYEPAGSGGGGGDDQQIAGPDGGHPAMTPPDEGTRHGGNGNGGGGGGGYPAPQDNPYFSSYAAAAGSPGGGGGGGPPPVSAYPEQGFGSIPVGDGIAGPLPGDGDGGAADRLDSGDAHEPVTQRVIPAERLGQSLKLFVGQVPKNLIEEDLAYVFEPYGPIVDLTVIRDRRSGNHRGCAFVTFESGEDAMRVVADVHGRYKFDGAPWPAQVRPAAGEIDGDAEGGDGGEGESSFFFPRGV